MSAASRQRERDALHLHQRRGFPTWEQFRAWQAQVRAQWHDTPQRAESIEVWHHLTFVGRELVDMTYPVALDA